MSLTFDDCLKKFYNKLDENYKNFAKSYKQDADEMQKFLLERMKSSDDEFRSVFKLANLAQELHMDIDWQLPDFFEVQVTLELPVSLQPELCGNSPGYVLLKTNKRHFLDSDGYLSRSKLHAWFKGMLSRTIGTGIWHRTIVGRTYKITYDLNSINNGVIAVDENNRKREISMDFIPIFLFSPQQWILPTILASSYWAATPKAVISTENAHRSFAICAPHWTHVPLTVFHNDNLKHAYRLIKALCTNNELWHLNGFILKSLFNDELNLLAAEFSTKSTSAILIKMLKSLIKSLENRYLPCYLDINLNHMVTLDHMETQKYIKKLKTFVAYFSELEEEGKAQFAYFKKEFGINP